MYKTKLVLLGNPCVGKSAIINQYINKIFEGEFILKNYNYNCTKEIKINNKKVILQLWDTGGAERFRQVNKLYMKDSKIVLIVYDITNRSSFEELNNLIQDVKEVNKNEELIIGIAANKSDLYKIEEVSYEEGKKFAIDNNCLIYETSAKDYNSLEIAFEGLARAYVEQIERNEKNINLIEDKKIEYKKKKYKNGDIYEIL